jgi:hypothetical protein
LQHLKISVGFTDRDRRCRQLSRVPYAALCDLLGIKTVDGCRGTGADGHPLLESPARSTAPKLSYRREDAWGPAFARDRNPQETA